MTKKFVGTELESQMQALPEWRAVDGKLERKLVFEDFMEAVNFVNEVAALAEEVGHHPDINIHWNTVTLELWTHSAKAITDKDTALAAEVDRLIAEWK